MDIMTQLRSKYLSYAQTLGDLEFQIFVLSQRRDELRKLMQTLDASVPEIQSALKAQSDQTQLKSVDTELLKKVEHGKKEKV